jgi:YkoY family integral membrane protein
MDASLGRIFAALPLDTPKRTRTVGAMLADVLAAAADFWPAVVHALPVILALILIEGLLSVDNALAIAAMASHLDPKRRALAMNIGYAGAYGFRLVALFFAAVIIKHDWVMVLGALYLIWLMCAHFVEQTGGGTDEGEATNVHHRTFAGTITMIALMDLSLSVDNVVAAIALSPNELWPVYVGVTIGIIALRLVASVAVKMIEKYPVLEHTAFVLVGYVGLLLLSELWMHDFFDALGPMKVKLVKFAGIIVLTLLTVAWSRSAPLQAALRPVLRAVMVPMHVFAAVVGALIVLVTWPCKALIRTVKQAKV